MGSSAVRPPLSALVDASSSLEKSMFAVTQEEEAKDRGLSWGAEWR